MAPIVGAARKPSGPLASPDSVTVASISRRSLTLRLAPSRLPAAIGAAAGWISGRLRVSQVWPIFLGQPCNQPRSIEMSWST
ncbi:hypothetical protein D9M70_635010 [compost metagenome]